VFDFFAALNFADILEALYNIGFSIWGIFFLYSFPFHKKANKYSMCGKVNLFLTLWRILNFKRIPEI